MAIIRGSRPSDRFVQMANAAAQDERLSYRARGMLVALLSRPPGWKTSSNQLAKQGKEGRDAVQSALRELEKFGYLERHRTRTAAGVWQYDQFVTDEPDHSPGPENPSLDLTSGNTASSQVRPEPGKPATVFQAVSTKTDVSKTERKTAGVLGGGTSPSVPRATATQPPQKIRAGDNDDGFAASAYPRQCTDHQDEKNTAPCAGCKTAREFAERAAQLHEENIRRSTRALSLEPECGHGVPGGTWPHPAAPERLWCIRCEHQEPADDIPTPTAADMEALTQMLTRSNS